MKVTGYQIKQSVEQFEITKSALEEELEAVQIGFRKDAKRTVKEVADELELVERNIAKLQSAQITYNEAVKVWIDGEQVSLTYAIKVSGPAGRSESRWKKLSKVRERNSYGSTEREPGKEYTEVLVDTKQALIEAKAAAIRKAMIGAQVGIGNASEVEIGGIDNLIV